jgi:hypothetical protein
MQKMNAPNDGVKPKIGWLEEEFKLLKAAVDENDLNKSRHQVYDMLFLLFEVSADYNFDLDKEWDLGRERKQKKYIDRE